MKQLVKSFFSLLLFYGAMILLFSSCKTSSELKLIDWKEANMYQLPQQVIDFYYNADTSAKKIFAVLDASYVADEKFMKISQLSETHYIIQINNQPLNIRERDFRAPFLIFNGKMYYSKSLILKGKLMTPQDLFIYYVDLKTVLK